MHSPRASQARVPTTPPLLTRANEEPLFLGLEQNCLKQVRLALEADPEAARTPFWEPRFEWPLCAAIRLGCSADIVSMLIENGAKVDATDVYGQSPLQLLSSGAAGKTFSVPCIDLPGTSRTAELLEWMREDTARSELSVAAVLVTSGADPEACHGGIGGGRASSLELARRAGKEHLVGLYETGVSLPTA